MARGGTVLLTRFSALGDVAMTVPVVYSACRLEPERRFVMVTRPFPAGLFVNAPENLTVRGVNLAEYRGVMGLWRLARELRREYGVGVYADLHDVLRTKVLRVAMRLAGVRTSRIRKGRREKRRLTRQDGGKRIWELESTQSRYAAALAAVGVRSDEGFVSVWDGVEPDAVLYAKATGPRGEGERWIGVAPFAGHRGKTLPEATVAEVVRRLSEREGVKVFLFGAGGEESAAIERIRAGAVAGERVVNMAALRLGLEAEMALIRECEVMVSMDSSNLHIASLVGTRAVSVWGATHAFAGFGGWKQDAADRVQVPLGCRPCSVYGNRGCVRVGDEYACLRGITAEHVLGVVDRRVAAPAIRRR